MIEYEPLSRHTSWRIGGPARYYLEARSISEIQSALAWGQAHNLPILVIGGGTNLLVSDAGFPGLVLRYRAQTWDIQDQGDTAILAVQAGAPMAGTVRRVCAQGWAGLEWAEGLPGTIGGAVSGNAGCYGGDVAGVLHHAHVLVGDELQEWPVERFAYTYRSSALRQHAVAQATVLPGTPLVLAAAFRLKRGDPQELAETMAQIAVQRKAKTPWGSSCGSVFKNPRSTGAAAGSLLSAGQLIDQAGLKGTRIGAAEISPKHANYIVNLGGAQSDDVLRLIDLARETVAREFAITLELEIQVVGCTS